MSLAVLCSTLAPLAGVSQTTAPLYELKLVLDAGFGEAGASGSVDFARNRLSMPSRDGLRFMDLATGTIGPLVSRLAFTGSWVPAPDIGRVFAESGRGRVVILNDATWEVVGQLDTHTIDSMTYDAESRELYVFAYRASEVQVFSGEAGKFVTSVKLPRWGARGEVLIPGRVFVRIADQYMILNTRTKSLERFPLPDGLGRLRLFGDRAGKIVFATTDHQLLAFDAESAALQGAFSIGDGGEAAFDPISEVVLVAARPPGSPVRRLMVVRHEDLGFRKLAEQDLPAYGQGRPLATPMGFVNAGVVGGVRVDPLLEDSRRSKLLIWERVPH